MNNRGASANLSQFHRESPETNQPRIPTSTSGARERDRDPETKLHAVHSQRTHAGFRFRSVSSRMIHMRCWSWSAHIPTSSPQVLSHHPPTRMTRRDPELPTMPARTQSTLRSTPPQPRSLTRQVMVALRDWPIMLAEAGLAAALIFLMLVQCFVNAPLPETSADLDPMSSPSSRREPVRSDVPPYLLCGPRLSDESIPSDTCLATDRAEPQNMNPNPNLHAAQVLGV